MIANRVNMKSEKLSNKLLSDKQIEETLLTICNIDNNLGNYQVAGNNLYIKKNNNSYFEFVGQVESKKYVKEIVKNLGLKF